VRQIVSLIALLGTLGWLACVLPDLPPEQSNATDPLGPWRRTTAGWENSSAWSAPALRCPPDLHPLVASAVLLVGVLGGALLVRSRQAEYPDLVARPEESRRKCLPSAAHERQQLFPFLSSDS
jgi:hypothetical protein